MKPLLLLVTLLLPLSAARAGELEADYTKEEILEAYLNQVYLGHVEGVPVVR